MTTDAARDQSLGRNITKSIATGFFGLFLGVASSVVDPYAIPKSAQKIHDGRVKDLSDFTFYISGGIGYIAGIVSEVALITNYGERPEAWIPIVTNLVSGVAQHYYNVGRRRGNQDL